ncbi:MAG: type VI secretion system tip protein VgrG [Myxococcota bacterium]|nr:type VI secretion system tip protein VgrG [Myxococcota bacterium]
MDLARSIPGVDPGVAEGLGHAARFVHAAETIVGAAHQVFETVQGIVEDARHARVELSFECRDVEGATWRVRDVEIEEEIGRPYLALIQLSSQDEHADAMAMLGARGTLRLRRGERERVIHGIVSRVRHGDRGEHLACATVHLEPALGALRYGTDTRYFQGRTVPEILDEVLSNRLEAYGRTADLAFLDQQKAWLPREYCVQYQESDLDFCHRLMEEEGLTYWFVSDSEREVMTITGQNSDMVHVADDGRTQFVRHRSSDSHGAEPIYSLRERRDIGVSGTVVRDFDWTRAENLAIEARASSPETDEGGPERDSYCHERSLTITGYDKDQGNYRSSDEADQALLRQRASDTAKRRYEGGGAVTALAPSRRFTLYGHPDLHLDGEYLVTKVVHRARDPHVDTIAATDGEHASRHAEYSNTFECIRARDEYVPPRVTPKPRVPGFQSAVVVGPGSEEIHTDEWGRVRVQFHWDRQGIADECSTCWVRVAQTWAGPSYGFVFLPRVGMEVMVAFLDGDPDRPVVSGCVYNRDNPLPNPQPDSKTRSVIRTRSSLESEGYNELSFEDLAGKEQVYLRAERDLDEEILHDHTTHVGRDQSNHVERNQSERVDQNQKLRVGGEREKTVVGDERNTIERTRTTKIIENETLDVGGARVINVIGEEEHVVESDRLLKVLGTEREVLGAREARVFSHDNLTVDEGADRNVHVTGGHHIRADERFLVKHAHTQLRLEEDRALVASPSAITLQVGSAPAARIGLDANGHVRIDATSRITFAVGNSFIAIENDRITIHASDTAVMRTGPSSYVKVGASYAQMKSDNVDVAATVLASVSGGLVKLN